MHTWFFTSAAAGVAILMGLYGLLVLAFELRAAMAREQGASGPEGVEQEGVGAQGDTQENGDGTDGTIGHGRLPIGAGACGLAGDTLDISAAELRRRTPLAST
eukprot:scaffold125023_cov33-Tisochrysis_lutea.AAC.3